MPAADPDDSFLRHRVAVLDALLSDPVLGGTDMSGSLPVGPAPGLDDRSSARKRLSRDGLDVGEPSDPVDPLEDLDYPPTRPTEHEGPRGPRASEQILALLNGQTADAQAPDFATVLPDRSAQVDRGLDSEASDSPRSGQGALQRPADRVRNFLLVVRKPKVALMIGGGIVLALILVLVFSGGDNKTDRLVLPTAAPTAGGNPSATAPTPSTPPGSTIQPRAVKAHCPPGGASGSDAFAGPGKAWTCARAYHLDGQVLTIDLGHTYLIDSISVVPGFDEIGTDGADQWTKYRTVSRVSYQFDDPNATSYTQQTLDQRAPVVTKMNPPVSASTIVLTVLQSKGDQAVNSVALSSIVITGH
ncbi:hypothetical protein [Nocardia sp. NBC_00511]|uniref:hypothetical protein n=1 Tax=Nocardia sp. NBC_00511 TaxID=2903591 RepID=UPI002F907AF6